MKSESIRKWIMIVFSNILDSYNAIHSHLVGSVKWS